MGAADIFGVSMITANVVALFVVFALVVRARRS